MQEVHTAYTSSFALYFLQLLIKNHMFGKWGGGGFYAMFSAHWYDSHMALDILPE